MKVLLATSLLAGLAGGLLGAATYALISGNDAADHGSVVRFGKHFHEIETTPFCVELQRFCLVQSESGEFSALYTYDTHQWSRERNCEIVWRPDMLFTDPETQEETRGWFRSGCSGATFRYNGERVFGPAPRDMDQFPVEEKTSVEETSDGDRVTVEWLEVDTRRLICGQVASPSVPEGCERAPMPQ